MSSSDNGGVWFAVRCVFLSEDGPQRSTAVYEERITLWQASSAEEAIQRAEAEALEYANPGSQYLEIAQSYQLFGAPRDGAEVFSLMRTSDLESDEYLDRFFDTGTERQQTTE